MANTAPVNAIAVEPALLSNSGFTDDERTDREILLETNRLAHRIILKNARSIDEIEATWKIVNESIDALELPPRIHQSLVLNNVVTVRQLLEYSADQLLQLEDMGRLGRNTITEILSEHGLRLREKRTQPNQNLAIPEQKPLPATAPEHQESQAIMSENLDAPLMETGYKVGDLVKHPTQSAWGVGEIISLQDNNLADIQFDTVGKKTLSLEHARLLKIGSREQTVGWQKDRETPVQDFPKALCANCGQPTQFGEKTAHRRAELGWCDSCYKHSQRTFQDKVTGEKRYFDEFRTIDGIKSRFNPK